MRVIFEVSPNIQGIKKSEFVWLRNELGWLFVIEDGKILRTIGSKPDPGLDLQSTTLTETRICTGHSWNKDGGLLALIVDQRQIYFWRIDTNNFTHFKPVSLISSANDVSRPRRIEKIEWSRVTNRLLICYSTGELLLCDSDDGLSETFIHNSEGLMNEVEILETSDHQDMFVCSSAKGEILAMTFSGEVKCYVQMDGLIVTRMRLSQTFEDFTLERGPKGELLKQKGAWLAYQTADDQISFKAIALDGRGGYGGTTNDAIYSQDKIESESKLVNFYWVGSSHLVVCFSKGNILLLNLKRSSISKLIEVSSVDMTMSCKSSDMIPQNQHVKAFELNLNKTSNGDLSFALCLICDTKLIYHNLVDIRSREFVLEDIDSLDLSSSLNSLGLTVERSAWSKDCSLLAVQLSNLHILVCQTKLNNFLIDCKGSHVAYVSEGSEVTVLNYEAEMKNCESGNAITIVSKLQPSVLAIGPRHLAVALNNRVQFYTTEARAEDLSRGADSSRLIAECEYSAIVKEISLSSRFVAVLFEDLRLKIHAISSKNSETRDLRERFFPDPERPDGISAFTLTESHLIYCTKASLQIMVFSVQDWCGLQSLGHLGLTIKPVAKLRANGTANKFVCLPPLLSSSPSSSSSNAYEGAKGLMLYDLFRNEVVGFGGGQIYSKIYASQLPADYPGPKQMAATELRDLRLTEILDAIWDTDGRSFLLVERRHVHIFVVLDHTLECEGPIVVHVSSTTKLSSHTPLYASQGIVSYQTVLGRMINSILETHEDERKLLNLEHQISKLKSLVRDPNETTESDGRPLEAQMRLLALKLGYLGGIIPLYSLIRSKDICDHLMEEEMFNLGDGKTNRELDLIVWRQLAAWSVFTMNLNFALLIYRRQKMIEEAAFLRALIANLQRGRRLDARAYVKSNLMSLLTGGRQGRDAPGSSGKTEK